MLIELTVYWIEMEELTKNLEKDMPDQKTKTIEETKVEIK